VVVQTLCSGCAHGVAAALNSTSTPAMLCIIVCAVAPAACLLHISRLCAASALHRAATNGEVGFSRS
jgi:hypothetical protein